MEFILLILSSLLFVLPSYYPNLFFLSYFAFIPMIYLIRNYDYSHSFIIALLIGFLNSVFSFYWLYRPLKELFKMPFSFNLFILFLYFLISALPLAIWAVINKFLQPTKSYSPFIAALSWTCLEYLRFKFFNFNPLNYIAYSQSSFNLISKYASYGGIFLVGFITVLIASYFVKIYLDPNWKKIIPIFIIFLVLIIIPFFDQSDSIQDRNYKKIDLAVIKTESTSNQFKKIEAEIKAVAKLITTAKSEYIFFPEKSLSFDLLRNNYYRKKLKNNLEKSKQGYYLQLGSKAAEANSYNSPIYNSLFLVRDNLEIVNRTNKKTNILTGLNFYYPPKIIENFEFITDFKPNKKSFDSAQLLNKVKIDDLSYLNIFADQIFIPLIETDDLNLIVNSASETEIDSLVYNNLTLSAAVYRAAEISTPLIRVVNGGYSAYINAQGKILNKKRLINNQETVNLVLEKKTSYYQKNPEKIMNILIVILLIITLIKIIVLTKTKLSSS